MILQNTTKNINQLLLRIENYYFNNEPYWDQQILKERWSVYSEIFNQLIKLNKVNSLYELEYRILDGENLNYVLKTIIDSDDEIYLILYPFIFVLEEYHAFDSIKIFL